MKGTATSPDSRRNPYSDPQAKPAWAQLSRLAGDRAAILFEDLRGRVGRIDGLREELVYLGPDQGWAPCYKVDDETLFCALILPGSLEACIDLDEGLRQRLLASARLTGEIKQAVQGAAVVGGKVAVCVRLSKPSLVRSFASMVMIKQRFRGIPQGPGLATSEGQ